MEVLCDAAKWSTSKIRGLGLGAWGINDFEKYCLHRSQLWILGFVRTDNVHTF